ncbi:MAG: flagellar hook-basal body complex protein [Bacillota bacterium]
MLRSLYSGVSGLRNHQVRMDVIANNIANVNTTGFKASRANFQDILAQTMGGTAINATQIGLGVSVGTIDNVHIQGALQATGRTLDMAVEGNGFFVVRPVDSSGTTIDNPMYTRDGTFYIDKDGYLATAQGYRVSDSSGADIRFTNPDQIVSIDVTTTGIITATDAAGGKQTATIGLAMVNNVESLQRRGNNLWDVTALTLPNPPGVDVPGTNGRGIIRSGFLEMSNVDLAMEFTTMIATERGYQANARVITTSDEMLRELIDLKR